MMQEGAERTFRAVCDRCQKPCPEHGCSHDDAAHKARLEAWDVPCRDGLSLDRFAAREIQATCWECSRSGMQ
jgi:hypothetical protein